MTTLNQFIYINENKLVDVDKSYGAQCWDLVELYAEQVLQTPKEPWAITLGPDGAAREAWTVFDAHMQKYFDKIPKGQQKPGDINVYGPHGVFTEGHMAIELGNGDVFEQNADPDNSPAHTAIRAETYLLGSLRRKEEPVVNKGDVVNLYIALLGRQPDPAGLNSDIGQPWPVVFHNIVNSPEYAKRQALIKAALDK